MAPYSLLLLIPWVVAELLLLTVSRLPIPLSRIFATAGRYLPAYFSFTTLCIHSVPLWYLLHSFLCLPDIHTWFSFWHSSQHFMICHEAYHMLINQSFLLLIRIHQCFFTDSIYHSRDSGRYFEYFILCSAGVNGKYFPANSAINFQQISAVKNQQFIMPHISWGVSPGSVFYSNGRSTSWSESIE